MRAAVDEAGQRFLACLHRSRAHQRFDSCPLRTVPLENGKAKFRSLDKLQALTLLARHFGIFRDRVEVTATVDRSVLSSLITPEEKAELLSADGAAFRRHPLSLTCSVPEPWCGRGRHRSNTSGTFSRDGSWTDE